MDQAFYVSGARRWRCAETEGLIAKDPGNPSDTIDPGIFNRIAVGGEASGRGTRRAILRSTPASVATYLHVAKLKREHTGHA